MNRVYDPGLEEWFYPAARRVASAIYGEERDWKGRIPILVEDCWKTQQTRITMLERELRSVQTEMKVMIGLQEARKGNVVEICLDESKWIDDIED